MFEEFLAVDLDVSKIEWRNLFRRQSGEASIEQDYEKLHNEDSVNAAAWMEQAQKLLNLDLLRHVAWQPAVEIVMEG